MTKTEQQLAYIYEQCGSPIEFTPMRQYALIENEFGREEVASPHGEFNKPIEIGLGHVLNLLKSCKRNGKNRHWHIELHEYGLLVMDSEYCTDNFKWVDIAGGDEEKLRHQTLDTIETIAKLTGWKNE